MNRHTIIYSMYRVDALRRASRQRAGYPTQLQWRGRYDVSRLKTSPWLPHVRVGNRVFSHSLNVVFKMYILFTVIFSHALYQKRYNQLITQLFYGRGLPQIFYVMYTSFVLRVRSLILLRGLCHYMWLIVILSLCMCNGICTIIQLCMFNAMLGFVDIASAICVLTMSVLNASIVMLCHTFFVVLAVKSAIVATCMQTGSSQYVILRCDHFGFHTRSVKMPLRILTSSL